MYDCKIIFVKIILILTLSRPSYSALPEKRAKSVNPDEAAHHEPLHQDPCCVIFNFYYLGALIKLFPKLLHIVSKLQLCQKCSK